MPRDMGNKRRTVAIDIDATLAEYHGFKNWDVIGDLRTDAKWALHAFHVDDWTIILFTTRADINAVWDWTRKVGIEHMIDYVNVNPANIELNCNMGKPLCRLFIDDRAYPYCGERPIVWKEIMEDLFNRGIIEMLRPSTQ